MEESLSIHEVLEWSQDPLRTCGGAPVILKQEFQRLAEVLSNYPEVTMTVEEMLFLFTEQSKRFVGCGGNFGGSDRSSLLRKNPATGWKYIIDIITEENQ